MTEAVSAYQGDFNGLALVAIAHKDSFNRNGIYDERQQAYNDNPFRFAMMTKASLDWCQLNSWQPDIVHANDWQSSLAGFYLAEHFKHESFFTNTRSILTLHNAAYQMYCEQHELTYLGIDERFYTEQDFKQQDGLNLLKGSLGFTDGIVTVSPGYAQELKTELGGHGLADKINSLSQPFKGILNGSDESQWNPESDIYISSHFSASDLSGKQQCKLDLQQRLSLASEVSKPLLGVICRLTEQKGIDLLIPAFKQLMQANQCQIVVLGSGDEQLASELLELAENNQQNFKFINGYDIELSHQIEAGCDAFLMPSIFEPCGLNQIYSLRYGTLPLVRQVGGLKDTVCRLADDYTNRDQATGFMFLEANSTALLRELERLLAVYNQQPDVWQQLQQNAMQQRFSWQKAAQQYEQFYQLLLSQEKVAHPLI